MLRCLGKFVRGRSRQSALFIMVFSQMRGRLDQNDFKCRPHMSVQEVAASGRAVGSADHHVHVDLRFTVLERHIANERKDLDLFTHRDFLVLLRFPVEVAECHLAELRRSR